MLRDHFSDEDEELEENEETTTVSSEETTANWRKRGFKRKRIKRPRSSSTEDRPTGGTYDGDDGHSAKCSFVRAASFHPVGELWDAERLVPTETELSNFFGISLATPSCNPPSKCSHVSVTTEAATDMPSFLDDDERNTLEDVLFSEDEENYVDDVASKDFFIALRLAPRPENLVKGYEFKMLNR